MDLEAAIEVVIWEYFRIDEALGPIKTNVRVEVVAYGTVSKRPSWEDLPLQKYNRKSIGK